MADQAQPASGDLHIPADTQAKFGPIIALIQGSESMNLEERQYWINILPIMTAEQLKNLEDILHSEKQQLAAIDAKYSKDAGANSSGSSIASTEEKIRARKQERQKNESVELETEKEREGDILSQIQSL